MRARLPKALAEFIMFGLKMAWACLFAATVLVFWRVRIYFTPFGHRLWMPLVLAAFLSSLFLYAAENVGTLTGTWLYAGSRSFSFASIAKLGSWYLLLYVSFVQVTLVQRRVLRFRAG